MGKIQGCVWISTQNTSGNELGAGVAYLTAKRGWKTILSSILLFEVLAAEDELLSKGMDRLLERHPVWPRLAVLAVALHLCNWLPEKIDPVGWLFSTRFRRLSWPLKH